MWHGMIFFSSLYFKQYEQEFFLIVSVIIHPFLHLKQQKATGIFSPAGPLTLTLTRYEQAEEVKFFFFSSLLR